MQVLPSLNSQFIHQFHKIIRSFLWNNKRARIALRILQTDKQVGGLRLTELHKKELSLKLVWVKEIQQNPFFNFIFYEQLQCPEKENIWKCHLTAKDAKNLCRTQFWGDVLAAWSALNAQSVITAQDVSRQTLWGNSQIKIDNQLIFNVRAWKAGLITVADLFDNDKNILTYTQLCTRFGPVISWFLHLQLLDAIPILWKQIIQKSGVSLSLRGRNVERIMGLTANNTYTQLIDNPNVIMTKRDRWERILQCEIEDEEFTDLFKNIYSTSIATKFRNFQYLFLHHAIVTNRMLFIWKILDSDFCTFCNANVETYTHLFYECGSVKNLWMDLRLLLTKYNIVNLDFSLRNIMFNQVHANKNHVINFIVLITKQYIYRSRCFKEKPKFSTLLREIENVYKVEEHLAKVRNNWNKHVKKWRALKPDLEFVTNCDFVSQYIENL